MAHSWSPKQPNRPGRDAVAVSRPRRYRTVSPRSARNASVSSVRPSVVRRYQRQPARSVDGSGASSPPGAAPLAAVGGASTTPGPGCQRRSWAGRVG
ncbi:Uncharacterised protein [Mycobacteroides abscessus]|nr:Uncharacterised protein [Mycobacteroides abscessus]